MEKTPQDTPSENNKKILYAILFAALLLRLLTLSQSLDNPSLFSHDLDEGYYLNLARTIAGGDLIAGNEPFFMDPLYGYLVGGFFAIFGDNLAFLWIAQILIDCLSVFLIYRLGKEIYSRDAGLIGAGLYALYRPAFFYPLLVLKTTLTTAALLGFTLLFSSAVKTPENHKKWLGLGILCGAMITLRANMLLVIPLGAIFLFLRLRPDQRIAFKASAIVVCGAIFFPLATGGRNLAATGQFTILNTQGGRLLYSCNNPENLTGTYGNPSFARGTVRGAEEDFHREAEKRLNKKLSDREVSSYWYLQAISFWQKHPGQALRALAQKAAFAFGDHEIPTNQSFAAAAFFAPILGWPLPSFSIILGLGLVGIIAGIRTRNETTILIIPLGAVFLTMLIFYASSRLRTPGVPYLAIGAGIFIVMVRDWLAGKKLKSLLLMGAGATALTTASLFIPPPKSNGFEELLVARSFLAINSLADARQWAIRGAKKYPGKGSFHRLLGLIAIKSDKPAEAFSQLATAIDLGESDPEAFNQLAFAALAAGKIKEGLHAIEAALAAEPTNRNFLLNKARLLAAAEKGEETTDSSPAIFP